MRAQLSLAQARNGQVGNGNGNGNGFGSENALVESPDNFHNYVNGFDDRSNGVGAGGTSSQGIALIHDESISTPAAAVLGGLGVERTISSVLAQY